MMLRSLKSIFLLATFIAVSHASQAQNEADRLFEQKNFDEAYNAYSQLPPAKLKHEQRYRMAVSLLNGSLRDKSPALPLLEKYLSAKPADGNAHYLYGRALFYAQKFNEAEKEFTTSTVSKNITDENRNDAGIQLGYCQNARARIAVPTSVKLENLGKAVNSGFADYYPFANANGGIIYFNTRRNDGSTEKPNGDFTANIYYTMVNNGVYTNAKPVTGEMLAPDRDEEIVGLSADGRKAIVSMDNKMGDADLYVVNLAAGEIISVDEMNKGINSKGQDIAASFGAKQDEFVFASDRPGGFGGTDLYILRKRPGGGWAQPQNLGPGVNTKYDEDFPVLSADGLTLYFSSKGHSSMGGYDIFKATFDEHIAGYNKPINVGYPINTLFDDMNLNMSEGGQYGYMSRLTDNDSYDIFRVTFEDIDPDITIVTGTLEAERGEDELLSINMSVVRTDTGEQVGDYQPNSGTLRYVMALPPGTYQVTIEAEGYQLYESELFLPGKSDFVPHVVQDYKLKRK